MDKTRWPLCCATRQIQCILGLVFSAMYRRLKVLTKSLAFCGRPPTPCLMSDSFRAFSVHCPRRVVLTQPLRRKHRVRSACGRRPRQCVLQLRGGLRKRPNSNIKWFRLRRNHVHSHRCAPYASGSFAPITSFLCGTQISSSSRSIASMLPTVNGAGRAVFGGWPPLSKPNQWWWQGLNMDALSLRSHHVVM